MAWTTTEKLNALMRLNWTVKPSRDDEGLILTVAELSSVIATGSSPDEVERDFWVALRATLETYLKFDDEKHIPLPPGVRALPWEAKSPFVRRPRYVIKATADALAAERDDAETATSGLAIQPL